MERNVLGWKTVMSAQKYKKWGINVLEFSTELHMKSHFPVIFNVYEAEGINKLNQS